MTPDIADRANRIIEFLVEISFGSCSITPETIMAEQNDRPMAEMLTGLLFLHEDLKLRAQQRDAAEQELKALDAQKTRFFANISHEFRTPLTLMLGPLEEVLARPAGALGEDDRANAAVAHRNALRLLKLVNSLLDFARIEAGRTAAVYVPTDAAALTASIASMFRAAAEKAGLELVVDCPPLAEPVFLDRDMWEKIVLNLLSNAYKFTQSGRIAVRQRIASGHLELAVEDTGCGIPEAELDKVFKRFHRVDGTRGRTHEGAGIGLALVEELARSHGGSVRVASTFGAGSTFFVSIPTGNAHLPADRLGTAAAAAEAAEATAQSQAFVDEALRWLPADAAPEPDAAPEQAKPYVLVADDNADMRAYVRSLLSEQYEVVAVADGEAAWDEITARPPDLVLTDIMMPRLDGVGLLGRVRAEPRTRSVPVILLSARAGEEARVGGLDAGADDYLTKPFSARELQARIRATLELARLRREVAETAVLREQNRRKDEFLAMLAHELRNPLAAIAMAAQIPRPAGLGEEAAEVVDRNVAYLSRLIDDLLDVSRATHGKIELLKQSLEVMPIIARAVESVQALVEKRGHKLTIAYTPKPMWLDADPVRLEQIVVNLLGNAAKYTPEGGRIWVEAEQDGGDVVLRVRDDGPGIAPDLLPHVFELFTQGERSLARAEGGLGIGLTLVKTLCELHGGSVTIGNVEGGGCEVAVRLPGLELAPVEAAPAVADELDADAGAAAAARSVLVVDDNRDAALLLRYLLEAAGHQVATAHDGRSALELAQSMRPDTVFLDIGLPGLNGYEVASLLRRDDAFRDTRLVAVSGYGRDEDKHRAFTAGFDCYLVKPVSRSAVVALLR